MFQTKFSDAMAEIENRLNNIRSCCDFLTTSLNMKNMFAVTLACGNYMNGGNRQRGQADGFSIEILPKIKDVKSNTNTLNLLAYIVRFCILKFDENRGTQEAKLPVPEPSDLEKCQHIDFEVERGECGKVKRQLEKAKASTTKIFEKSPEELKEIRQAKKQRFWDYFSMVFSISYGIFIVVASVAAYGTDLLMGWSYQTNVGEYWNLALCTIGIILLLFLCFDIRRYMNLVMGMHKGSNKVDGIKLVEGEDGELHIEVPMQKGQKRNVPEYYGFTTGRSGYAVQKKSVK